MDSNRDTPILRFTTFWWGIGTFLIFAVLLVVVWVFNRDQPETLEEAASKPRYETKAKIDSAQAAAITPQALESAIAAESKKLVTSKPVAIEKPEQIVPGSETAKKLAAAPAVDTSTVDKVPENAAPADPKQIEAGQALYVMCAACHGQQGEGTAGVGPPLAGSEWVDGPVSNLIRIQLRGLEGPISVAGKEYTFPAGMFPLGLDDQQIADVLTYIRNSFGHKASAVTVEQVAALRSETGKPRLTQADLAKP